MNRRQLISRTISLILLVGLGLGSGIVGCSEFKSLPTVHAVSGQITRDGQPLDSVIIEFVPLDKSGGLPAGAVSDADGNYKLETTEPESQTKLAGALEGKYLIRLKRMETPDGKVINLENIPDDMYAASLGGVPEETLPSMFSTKGEAGLVLRREVKAGENTFNIDLTKEAEDAMGAAGGE